MARRIGLAAGMRAADVGCGIGGPLRQIARFSGATIVGINNNAYQIKRARQLNDAAGLSHLAEFIHCDFMNIDAPDDSFDAVYSIEATPHAPSKAGAYAEIFRVLRPGGLFGMYEWCLTDRYDPENPRHRQLIRDVEFGASLQELPYPRQIDDAMRAVGFNLLEKRDMAADPGPGIPWYQPLAGTRFSLAGMRSSALGRRLTHATLAVLEALRIVPRGTARVAGILNLCAAAMVEVGRLGIFTPMYFVLAEKPRRPQSTAGSG